MTVVALSPELCPLLNTSPRSDLGSPDLLHSSASAHHRTPRRLKAHSQRAPRRRMLTEDEAKFHFVIESFRVQQADDTAQNLQVEDRRTDALIRLDTFICLDNVRQAANLDQQHNFVASQTLLCHSPCSRSYPHTRKARNEKLQQYPSQKLLSSS